MNNKFLKFSNPILRIENLVTNKKILAYLLLFIAFLLLNGCSKEQGRKLTVESTVALEQVLEINELHSIEYVYNTYVLHTDLDIDTQCIENATDKIQSIVLSKEKFLALKKDIVNINFKSISFMQNFSKNFFNECFAENKDLVSFILIFHTLINECNNYDDYSKKIYKNNKYLYSTDFRKEIEKNIFEYKKANMNYAVSYRGIVIAGINEKIKLNIDFEKNIITVNIPKTKILSSTVTPDPSTMRFLYSDPKYKNGDIKNILSLCKKDLACKVKDNKAFLELAQQNVTATIKALCKPFENNLACEFKYVTIGGEK